MNETGQDDWREMLDPPAGGLTRLINSIESSRSASLWRRPRFALIGVAATGAFVVAFGLALRVDHNSPEYRLRGALETALSPAAVSTDIRVENGAALEIPSANPNVRMYWIAQLAPAAAEPVRK